MAVKKENIALEFERLPTRDLTFHILGTSPIILNRQSEKAKRQILMGSERKNAAEKAQSLKHNPIEEYRASAYRNRDVNAPTLLHLPEGMFKKALSTAALDTPGATKTQIGRLVSPTSMNINLWGIPYLKADMVRQADMKKTPDVRFRACIVQWATKIEFTFASSIIKPQSIMNLLGNAGIFCGIGDYRVEKGAGSFGKFDVVNSDDPEWNAIVESGGREVQLAAMETPQYYDDETQELVEWFNEEVGRRANRASSAAAVRVKKGSELTQ